MTVRRAILLAAFVVWATMIGLTLVDIADNGPSVLSLVALVMVGVLGVGVFGALGNG